MAHRVSWARGRLPARFCEFGDVSCRVRVVGEGGIQGAGALLGRVGRELSKKRSEVHVDLPEKQRRGQIGLKGAIHNERLTIE